VANHGSFRKAAGWTQAELAARAGVRQETISRIETGKHSPGLKTMAKIDRALKLAGVLSRPRFAAIRGARSPLWQRSVGSTLGWSTWISEHLCPFPCLLLTSDIADYTNYQCPILTKSMEGELSMAKKPNKSGTQWTPSEVKQLKTLAKGNTPTRVIGIKLERSEDSVRPKAQSEGISLKPTNQSPYGSKKK
jgi:DNA-binding XRE family transcriptional regulator